jgi:hypothetical protein
MISRITTRCVGTWMPARRCQGAAAVASGQTWAVVKSKARPSSVTVVVIRSGIAFANPRLDAAGIPCLRRIRRAVLGLTVIPATANSAAIPAGSRHPFYMIALG